MKSFKVHFIHIGHMANKGTQGIFKSDVTIIKELIDSNLSISVSTTDIKGVKKLCLPLDVVLPPMIDIPYEKADNFARKYNFDRNSIEYKLYAVMSLIFMFFQAILSILSAIFIKLGLKPFYRKDVLDKIKNCDLVISGSDEIFKEASSLLSINFIWLINWWSMLFSRTWDVLIAKFFGKNLIMFPNSVGPFKTFIGRTLSKVALNCYDCICIRENISFDIVKTLHLRCKKILTSDISLLLPTISPKHVFSLNNLIGVCPGVYDSGMPKEKINKYINVHAKALDRAINKYGLNVFFIPHYISGLKNDDLYISKLIIKNMVYNDKVKLIKTNSVDEFKSLLASMDVVISSKMHPAVFATSEFTPTLCIAYDHKQIGFFRILGLSNYVISIQNVSLKNLSLKIDDLWRDRIDIKNKLINIIPKLKQKERVDIQKVLSPYVSYINDQ